jgi:hypothetical protein
MMANGQAVDQGTKQLLGSKKEEVKFGLPTRILL